LLAIILYDIVRNPLLFLLMLRK